MSEMEEVEEMEEMEEMTSVFQKKIGHERVGPPVFLCMVWTKQKQLGSQKQFPHFGNN